MVVAVNLNYEKGEKKLMSIFKFPLKMHVGEACKPIVEEGQK